MNTDLSSGGLSIKPPIQLKYTYERLVAKEKAKVAATNKNLSSKATAFCEAQYPAGQIRARAQCVQEFITTHAVEEKSIPKELYQFDFVSPRWSPDLAGFSLLFSGLFLLLLIIRLGLGLILKIELS